MRAMFSLLGLLIVAAIVLMLVKQQLGGLKAPAAARPGGAASSAASSGPSGALPQPQAVGQQVQGTLDETAKRTAEAASAAGN